jgi:hypothetical protein
MQTDNYIGHIGSELHPAVLVVVLGYQDEIGAGRSHVYKGIHELSP